ncbi:PREDICTED: uncharacterized protein LOC108365918 [Rhagoletis zephyria]|uniref:uncharacterized protein LOC108365918 n=1 Tax=Rhagoletis zephyria TaxID=28612 RepID=UPI000811A615|nr:PREDICTED: uncharacterized protein LOC108365918 [Rhagoletis zephyria]
MQNMQRLNPCIYFARKRSKVNATLCQLFIVIHFMVILQRKIKMDQDGAPPTKKARQEPNHKWTEREVLLIIDFLHQEEDFEAPSAKFFYKRFLEKTQLNVTWELVRWKVRHLKSLYNKANDWLSGTGAGLLHKSDGVTIEEKLAKTCPHFDRLKEVFGKRFANIQPLLVSTDVSSPSPPQHSPASPTIVSPSSPELVNETAVDNSSAAPATAPASSSSSSFPREVAPRTAPKPSISQLAAVQKEKIAFEKNKMEFERAKFEKESEIQEKKVSVEEKRLDIEMKKLESEDKWKEKELELKKLEIEMKERISRYEIDKKYK